MAKQISIFNFKIIINPGFQKMTRNKVQFKINNHT